MEGARENPRIVTLIKFPCPACAARLRIEDDLAGRKVRCRACERVVLAPLEGDEADFKIVEREPDPDALQALVAQDKPKGGLRRKIAFGVGLGIVALSVLFVGWMLLFPDGSVPEIVTELPDGDFFVYRTAEGANFFRPEEHDFEGIRDLVTLYRDHERLVPLTIYRGDFKIAEIGKKLEDRGYVAETLDGEKLYLYPRSDEAIWLHRNRIFSGNRKAVQDALSVRRGKSASFLDSLKPPQERTLRRLPRGDVMYYGREPSTAERSFVANYTRGLLERVTPGPGGLGVSLRLEARDRAVLVAAIGYSDKREESGARDSLALLGDFVDGLEILPRDRVVTASGTLRAETLTWRANELEAVLALRRLAVGEAEFRENDHDHNGVRDFWTGDVSSLHRLHYEGAAIAVIDRDLAAADARPRPAGEEFGRIGVALPRQSWHGYWFEALEVNGSGASYLTDTDANGTAVHHPTAFAICAYPEQPRGTGEFTLILNEQGELWKKDTKGTPVKAWPADPEKEGWARVRP